MSETLFAKCQMLFENGQNMFVCCFDASCSIEEQFSQQVDAAVWEQVLFACQGEYQGSGRPVTFISTQF